MRFVVLPQAFRRMIPALVNEGVTLIKDSSLVSAIGLPSWRWPHAPWPAHIRATGNLIWRYRPSTSC